VNVDAGKRLSLIDDSVKGINSECLNIATRQLLVPLHSIEQCRKRIIRDGAATM
jgi:hypothetical protein